MPVFGLVCQTETPEVRYRTITRTRLLALEKNERARALLELYQDNTRRLMNAVVFCTRQGIGLYRLPTGLLPFADHPEGANLLERADVRNWLRAGGESIEAGKLRIVTHPDQFVVLNSEREEVVRNSMHLLESECAVLDALGLPRSPYTAVIIHGGKRGRSAQLAATIEQLPLSVKSRLVLENDERAYGAADILDICRKTGIPMVFDAHHHLVKERLASYADRSIGAFTKLAATTWPDPSFQLVHISNGRERLHDLRHSDTISVMPPAFRRVPFIEVEAKGKERALCELRKWFPQRLSIRT